MNGRLTVFVFLFGGLFAVFAQETKPQGPTADLLAARAEIQQLREQLQATLEQNAQCDAGWAGTLFEGIVYVNVPQTVGVLSKQRVLNTRG